MLCCECKSEKEDCFFVSARTDISAITTVHYRAQIFFLIFFTLHKITREKKNCYLCKKKLKRKKMMCERIKIDF